MVCRAIQWVNSPVLLEAMLRYEQGSLHHSMRLWVEHLFELDGTEPKGSLLDPVGHNPSAHTSLN
jgi:hypothetical protein